MRLFLLCIFGVLSFAVNDAFAATSFSSAQAPALGTQLNMGSAQSLTYAITNTSTGGNIGERIYEMRFRIGTGSLFSSSTAAPAGWTRTAFSGTSVTFRATSWANTIAVGGASVSFTLALAMRSTTANVNETLQDMRGSFTTTTTGPPICAVRSLNDQLSGLLDANVARNYLLPDH